jgi:hypothetical protein
MLETIQYNDKQLAIILRTGFLKSGIHFFTPNDYSQQLAYMNRPKDYAIDPHVHNVVPRNVELTQEVLFIKSGKVRVDFYNQERVYLESRILYAGDVILLAHGGHGFVMLEESEMIEVKQGPYAGEHDKVRFKGLEDSQINIKN